MSQSPAEFLAASTAVLTEAMVQIHGLLSTMPREDVMKTTTHMYYQCFDRGHLAPALAVAMIMLADEQGTHAMTAANFEAYIEEHREELRDLRADRDNLGVALEAALADLAEARAQRDDALDALAAIRGGPDG